MEQNQKQSKILEDCAEIAQSLKSNPYISTTQITIHIPKNKFGEILTEIEEFVKIKVNRTQDKLSIDINEVEFIFTRG